MSERSNMNWKTISSFLGAVVAVITIIIFVVEYLDLRSEIRSANVQLADCKEMNERGFSLLVAATSQSKITYTDLTRYLSEGEAESIVQKAGLSVRANFPFDLESQFFPSGWMGDGSKGDEHVSFNRIMLEINDEERVAIQINYRRGLEGWAGMYWQFPDNNWGDEPGKSLLGAKTISFLARGVTGEEIVEFKAGGIQGRKYSDSFEKSLGKVALSSQWRKFVIDISDEDVTNVIGGFAWIAAASDNRSDITFFIADLKVDK